MQEKKKNTNFTSFFCYDTLFPIPSNKCDICLVVNGFSNNKAKLDEVTTAMSMDNRTEMNQCIHSMGLR